MTSLTFAPDRVMSNQLANKTGNLSETLFVESDREFGAVPPGCVSGNMTDQNKTSWNTIECGGQGIQNQMDAWLNQSRLSTYYQDNPLPTLKFAKNNSGNPNFQPLGGNIIPGLAAGHMAGVEHQLYNTSSSVTQKTPKPVSTPVPQTNPARAVPKATPRAVPKATPRVVPKAVVAETNSPTSASTNSIIDTLKENGVAIYGGSTLVAVLGLVGAFFISQQKTT